MVTRGSLGDTGVHLVTQDTLETLRPTEGTVANLVTQGALETQGPLGNMVCT